MGIDRVSRNRYGIHFQGSNLAILLLIFTLYRLPINLRSRVLVLYLCIAVLVLGLIGRVLPSTLHKHNLTCGDDRDFLPFNPSLYTVPSDSNRKSDNPNNPGIDFQKRNQSGARDSPDNRHNQRVTLAPTGKFESCDICDEIKYEYGEGADSDDMFDPIQFQEFFKYVMSMFPVQGRNEPGTVFGQDLPVNTVFFESFTENGDGILCRIEASSSINLFAGTGFTP